MAFPPVVDHHNPNPNYLHLESLPLIDLGLLSQSDLYSLSLTSSSSSSQSRPTRRFDDNVLIPKIDRSVFNESAGSRKQTYSRLRLAPRNSQFPVPNPKSQKTIPHSQPRDPETLQIIALLKQLFPSEKGLKENDDVLVPVPVRLAQYDATPGPSAENFSAGLSVDVGTKRKRGRPRKYPNATISYLSVNADVSMEMRGGDNTTPGIVVQSSEGSRKRGRPRKDENRVVSVAKREKKVKVKEAKVKEGNVKVEEAEIVMVNGHGVVVDLAAVENADGLFGEELRRRTEGMDTEAQLLAFLGGLEGQWSSARKKRKIVPAEELGDVLPVHWKILLALKRNGGLVRLFCKRYISPNGQQFVSCEEVSSYLISYFGVGNKSIPGHTDGSIQLSNKLVSGDGANGALSVNEKFDNMSGLEGLGPGQFDYNIPTVQATSHTKESKVLSYDGELEQGFSSSDWLEKESLPSMPNITSRHEIITCVWCRNEFHHEVYERTQPGSVGLMCATCQANFSGDFL